MANLIDKAFSYGVNNYETNVVWLLFFLQNQVVTNVADRKELMGRLEKFEERVGPSRLNTIRSLVLVVIIHWQLEQWLICYKKLVESYYCDAEPIILYMGVARACLCMYVLSLDW